MSELINEIETFCNRHRVTPTRFGLMALNDKAFVGQVRAGRRTWPETEEKVRKFMAEYQPQSTAA